MKYWVAVAMATSFVGTARADTYIYICKGNSKSFTVKIDESRKELKLKGKTYNIKVQENCAKFGWHAESPGEGFDFCTATQGMAGFENGGPSGECRQKP